MDSYALRLGSSFLSLIVNGYGRFPKRFWSFLLHFKIWGSVAKYAYPSNLPGRTHRAAALRWWWLRLTCKLLDLLAIGEWSDFFTQLFSPRTRRLSQHEESEARLVFGEKLNWKQIRVLEGSKLAKAGKWHAGSESMAVAVGHTIHFSRKISCVPGSRDMRWLVHELTHVLQFEGIGLTYIPESLWAQRYGGYDYGGREALSGRPFASFNREQQAEICADFYRRVIFEGREDADYMRMMEEMRASL